MMKAEQNRSKSRHGWCFGLLLGGVLSLVASGVGVAGELEISEFLAANVSGLRDGDSERSDWIEIFNDGPGAVSLAGWSLTDDENELAKWVFPDIELEGGGYLVVFASGKDRRTAGGELHTNFSLDRDGEFLALVRPDGVVVSDFGAGYPAQARDVSYGTEMRVTRRELVGADADGLIRIPSDDAEDGNWTVAGFDDSAWARATMGVGYDGGEDGGEPPEVELVFGDVSSPSDLVVGTSANSPAGEEVAKAIDDNPATKYLNFDTLDAGLTVTLSRGASVVTGLVFTSANDAEERDPTSFVLLGSNDGVGFTRVAAGEIARFAGRFSDVEVSFENTGAYVQYRLLFPTVRDAGRAVAVQIAEVEFLGLIEKREVDPGVPLVDVTEAGDEIVPTSFNSPVGEEVEMAIDGNASTKYLNFDTLNAGFTVTPSGGVSVVTGLRFTSANDAVERDPTSFVLEGSSDGVVFAEIARGDIANFPGRFTEVEVRFPNDYSFGHYRLLFPTVRDAGRAVAVQIADVEFLGRFGEAAPEFGELIATDIGDELKGKAAGVYLRLPFLVAGGEAFEAPVLRVWYDDGFVAFIDGVEVARSNAAGPSGSGLLAEGNRARERAVLGEVFDLSGAAGLLREGVHVLALHGVNDARDSGDFLLRAELEESVVERGGRAYFAVPTPGAANGAGGVGIAEAPVASAGRGFYEKPFLLELSSPTGGASIRYTTDGSVPTEANGVAYSGPLEIGRTTVLRAVATGDGWLPSEVMTKSYLFTGDVVEQTRASVLASGFPATWGGQVADYGLDPRVVGAGGADSFGGKYVRVLEQSLLSLPTISLVVEGDDFFGARGIYANPNARGAAWERPVSFEWIDPASGDAFQENAGVRIQGGAFRRFDLSLKKSMRLIFRERYGAPRLKRSLFGDGAAEEVDSVVLRANGNDAWRWGGANTLYIRDAYAMETGRAMGMVTSHSSFAHLYINGVYWGLYNPAERPDAAFSSIYHGGDDDSWDAINQDSVPDGNGEAWGRMQAMAQQGLGDEARYQRIQGNDPDGTRNPELEVLLDVENMIDYMILNLYLGNADWPHRNFWTGRDRDGEEGFQFYPWDTETAMGLNSGLSTNRTGVGGSVATAYAAARANAGFRARFGDRVHAHFFNGGALYVNPDSPAWDGRAPENNRPAWRFSALADVVDAAVVGESARWGDQLSGSPFTRDEHWRRERDELLRDYFPRRSAVVLGQFRAAGLYPRVEAPSFGQHGGVVGSGYRLVMDAAAGLTVYTLDGSDPREAYEAGDVAAVIYAEPVELEGRVTVKARVLSGGEWSALNEATFRVGVPAVVVSELHYHPAEPSAAERQAGYGDADDFEFIEFSNGGSRTFDLSGVKIVDGVRFDFSGGAIESLAVGERVVVVRNVAAFEMRYGSTALVAGEYSGKFSNSGERVAVVDGGGEVLVDFVYDDGDGWPGDADGGGASLVLRGAGDDPGLAASWQGSGRGVVTPGRAAGAGRTVVDEIRRDEGEVVMGFEALPGVRYAIYCKGDLAEAAWRFCRALDPVAEGGSVLVRESIDAVSGRRFFVIVREEDE